MNNFKVYYWRDEQIMDIEKWTASRNEKMVDVIWLIKQVNPYAKKAKDMITWSEEKETMPEVFFNTLRYDDGRRIKSKKLRNPK